MIKKCFMDFETRSTVDLAKSGADVYARHPSTDWTMMSYQLGDAPVRAIVNPVLLDEIGEPEGCEWDYEFTTELPAELIEHVVSGGIVVAHNISFDFAIWNHVLFTRHKWPFLSYDQLEDTMAVGLAAAMPANLADLGTAVGVSVPKFLDGRKVMLKMCKPNREGEYVATPEMLGTYINYGCFDIPPMVEIDEALPALSDMEQKVWRLNFSINERGIPIDTALISRIKERQVVADAAIEKELIEFTDGDVDGTVCRSTPKLLRLFKENGVALPNLTKAVVQKYIKDMEGVDDIVAKVLSLRASYCKTSLKKFDAMLARVADGRVRGSHVYHRATTGRFAGQGVQVQNVPRPVIGQDEIDSYIAELMK